MFFGDLVYRSARDHTAPTSDFALFRSFLFVLAPCRRHEEVAKAMISDLGERSTETGLDVRGIVRLFGALQSNGFASGIYLHPAMTNHSCRYVGGLFFVGCSVRFMFAPVCASVSVWLCVLFVAGVRWYAICLRAWTIGFSGLYVFCLSEGVCTGRYFGRMYSCTLVWPWV